MTSPTAPSALEALRKKLERAFEAVEEAERDLSDAQSDVDKIENQIEEMEKLIRGQLSPELKLLVDLADCRLTGAEREAVEARLLGDEIPDSRILEIARNNHMHWTHRLAA